MRNYLVSSNTNNINKILGVSTRKFYATTFYIWV